MDCDTSRRLIAAARVLVRWDVETFAKALGVGVATVKRIEAGYSVRAETLSVILARLPGIGIAVIAGAPGSEDGAVVAGVAITKAARVGSPPTLKSSAKTTSRRQVHRTKSDD